MNESSEATAIEGPDENNISSTANEFVAVDNVNDASTSTNIIVPKKPVM